MELIVKINKLEDLNILDNATGYLVSNSRFSYRYDESFCINKIRKIKNFCKKNNKKIYVLVNKIFKDSELERLKGFLINLKNADVDGVFFADLAVFMLAKEIGFEDRLVFYHETFLRNSYDILTYKQYGIKKIICSKDMHIDDIEHLPKEFKDDFGILAFGYVPLYQSQRKIISNYVKLNNLDKSIIKSKTLTLKENTRDEQYKVIEQEGISSIFNSEVLSYHNDVLKLSNNINMLVFDSLFFDVNYIKKVIELFKDALNGHFVDEQIRKLDESLHLTDLFLNKKVGLM